MEDKISLEAIAVYGDAYADKVLKKFFDGKTHITGKDILSLSEIQQVNLFVVRELFRVWEEETRKLKSPYFNYDAEEVTKALEHFMSVLSRHIRMDQQHLRPLLKKAVSHTLMAIFDPYDYFSMIISGPSNKLEMANFKSDLKYLKVNHAPLQRLYEKLAERSVTEVPGNEAFAELDQILEEVNFTPEDLETYIEAFSKVEPLNPDRFYMKKPEPVAKPAKSIKITVNDTMAAEKPRTTVADNFQKIEKLKDSLTINQKFMFTKVLFHGDFESFSKAIDNLDRQDNLKGAMRYLENFLEEWDRESEEFHEFMELVEKRFS